MFLLWTVFAVTAYMAWKKVSNYVFHCWNQVGDEDAYIAEQAHRINMLDGRFYELGERVTETCNAQYDSRPRVRGAHALVDGGGFLRSGLGLTNDQWIHLNTLERAIMVAHHTMGTPNYRASG